jgi:hypothetical protein
MNTQAFMSRLFALRMVRHQLRANPGMEIKNFEIHVGSRTSPAVPIVRDYRLPPFVCVLEELSTGSRQVLVFAPPAPQTAE